MFDISAQVIKQFAIDKGADLVGIASVDRFNSYPDERKPDVLLSDAKSVIAVGVRVLKDTVKTNLLLSALHHITINMYHNQIAYEIGRFLDDNNFKAVVVPHRIGNLDPDLRSSPDYMEIYPKLFGISTRHAAYEAGLGVFGKSRLLLSKRFGPLQRFAAVITNANILPDVKIPDEEAKRICPPNCTICIKKCPGKAISVEKGIEWEKCNEVIRPHNGQYGYSACCECMISCPSGNK
ncbi:MAG TPA: hypothetical protein VHP36_01555 [Chitinispirillaceae bacterium]|nr:hypothetical protein [Chitinispirillaceae bacterium]